MRWHTVDYLEAHGNRRRTLLDRGFWLYNVPRLIPLCRWFGHRPVVDGTDSPNRHTRWVCCDRCGIRPEPQGNLDHETWAIGQRYTGPYQASLSTDAEERFRAIKASVEPGPWPATPTGTVGGQLVVGKSYSTGFELKIGNAGSEHVLAAHVTIEPLGGLYLHTEQHGTWLQRRLNPTGYESRIIGISVHNRRLYWQLWAKRNSRSNKDPRWQQGSFRVDPRDILFGEARYSYENVGDRVTWLLRMPHGDEHLLVLQLQRQTLRRRRGRGRQSWVVDWKHRPGIPTKPGDRGHILGSGVDVSHVAATEGGWPVEACAAIAVQLTRDRIRYGYQPAPLMTDEEPMRG